MFKKILSLSLLATLFILESVHAEHTLVDSQILNEFKANGSTFAIYDDNEVSKYENDKIKVYVKNNIFEDFPRPNYNKQRIPITQEYRDGIYFSVTKGLGGYDDYFSAVGVTLDFTNKTDEIMYIDLNESVISIGSYQGKPFTRSLSHAENNICNLPPIIILPHKTVTRKLYRADAKMVFDLMNDSRWTVPCDLALGKNILGDGTFVFAIGNKEQTKISMKFYRELNRKIIAKYIIAK